ncbi:MAG: hypothetical protein NVSMB33_05190 [Ktedonobacteraceae bacterium]
MTVREGIIVEVTTEQGIVGVGEIAPLPEFGGSTLAAAHSSLITLTAHIHGKTLEEALDLVGMMCLRSFKDILPSPVICGLEIALLDALGKTQGLEVSRLLAPGQAQSVHSRGTLSSRQVNGLASPRPPKLYTPPNRLFPSPAESISIRPHIPVNAVISAKSIEAAITEAQEALTAGFTCIKLKVGYHNDSQAEIERIAAVRQTMGPHIHLRLDANEAWSLEQAVAVLSRCTPYAIQYIEQPLPVHNLKGMYALRQAVAIPIAADEALYNLDSAQRILDHEAADILIIKPQLAGGLRMARQIIQRAAERGVRSVVTSTIEAGIGVAAVLHLAAASPEITLACGLATLHLLADDLIVEDLPIHNGILTVPTGAGLAVRLDKDALLRYS